MATQPPQKVPQQNVRVTLNLIDVLKVQLHNRPSILPGKACKKCESSRACSKMDEYLLPAASV